MDADEEGLIVGRFAVLRRPWFREFEELVDFEVLAIRNWSDSLRDLDSTQNINAQSV